MSHGENGPGDVGQRVREQEASCSIMGVVNLIWGDLPDLSISNYQKECVKIIESLCRDADVLYTHGEHDTHQDHRAVASCTLGAARKNQRILFYESPSAYNFNPNVYVDISTPYDTNSTCLDVKLEALHCHASQVLASDKVSPDHVRGNALHRGREALTMAAEGFVPHRFVLEI